MEFPTNDDPPRWQHDETGCVYIGRYKGQYNNYTESGDFDLYWRGDHSGTAIARFGDGESDFLLWPIFAGAQPPLAEAFHRAIDRGLVMRRCGVVFES